MEDTDPLRLNVDEDTGGVVDVVAGTSEPTWWQKIAPTMPFGMMEPKANSGALADKENAKEEESSEPPKSLSFISLISVCYFLVCGGAYGTEDLASAIPPFFALAGLLVLPWFWSLPIAITVAELGSAMPTSEGFLGWIRVAWGRPASFCDGFVMIINIIFDQALYPVIFISYVNSIHQLEPWEEFLISFGYITFAMILNLLGVASVGYASTVLTITTLLPFAVYVGAAPFNSRFDPGMWFRFEMVPEDREWDIALYLSVLLWATCAYEYAGFLVGDIKNPKRTFPLAMFTVVTMMIFTYALPLATTISTAENLGDVGEGSYPDLANGIASGSWLGWFIIVGGLASTMGTYVTYLHTSSTALRSLSERGMAPAIFNAFPAFKAPAVSIFFFSCTTLILVNIEFGVLVQINSFIYCVHAILLESCLLRLRWKKPNMERPFKVPLGWVGAAFVSVCPILVASAQIVALFYDNYVYALCALGVIVGAICVYLLMELWDHKLAPRLCGIDPPQHKYTDPWED